MQGQRSAVGSLPDTINFDYGSTPSNVGIDQQICWNNLRNPTDYAIASSNTDTFMGAVSQEARAPSRWNVGEPSSSSSQIPVSHDERIPQSGWSSSMPASAGTESRLLDQRFEPTNILSQANVNLNLGSHQIIDGASFARSSTSAVDCISHNHDLNEARFGGVGDDLMDCNNSSKSSGFENRFISSASSSSDAFASSSGSSGFLVEDDDGRPGCSLDGRRSSCKRKALEGNAGQSSGGGSSFTRTENNIWHPIPPQYDTGISVNVSTPSRSTNVSQPEPVNPGLGLAMGRTVISDSPRPLHVAGDAESSRRSYRMRMNPTSHPESMPNSSFLRGSAVGRPDVPLVHQPLRFVPVNPPLDLVSPQPPDSALRVPTFRRNMQALRWNGSSSARAGSSSGSIVSGDTNAPLPEDLNSRTTLRNVSEHPMFVPTIEGRNLGQNLTSWSPSSSNIGASRSVASSSRTGSRSGSFSSPGPSWASNRLPPSRSLSEYVRRSLLSSVGSEIGGQSSSSSVNRSGLGSSQEVLLPPGGGNQGHNQTYPRSALWMERQGDGVIGIPYSLRTWAAGEGRSRLVSEIRNVLDIMRRGEALRLEDVAFFDQAVFFGMADIHDQHRDMRLDVDNMSYEELLALEERIGNVCTGLSEEMILTRMKQRKYLPPTTRDQSEAEPCCICQEDYNEGEELGTLDCGHDFHSDCVKQWLSHKNLCPICKTTALST